MGEHLRVSYERDTDGTGRLVAAVSAEGFSGVGSAWFSETELIEFARLLGETYPLPPQGLPKLQGGYWSGSDPPTLEQPHVELRFYPIGSLGKIGCRVRLGMPREAFERPEQQSSVEVELVTSYEQAGAFARALAAVAQGQEREAILAAHGT
jgi:hypothetical protein